MDHRIFRENTWITLKPDRDSEAGFINIDEYEPRIKLALIEMENLKAREPDLDQRYYEDFENRFELNTSFDMQAITIYGFPEVEVVEEEEEGLEANFEDYVLLVEMGHEPGAFAVFKPDGEGHGACGGMNANMSFVGWTNNITSNQDPPGLVEQETNRAGWCDDPAPPRSADHPGTGYEQVKRVDQGWLAYTGSFYDPVEVNSLRNEGPVWTYEGIDHVVHWLSVDPGPPPYSLCGYTWAIHENYGGPGGGDYYDLRHLFYAVETAGRFNAWWPPEFNQLITRRQQWHEECILSPYFATYELVGYPDYIGLEQWYGDYAIPGSFSKITETVNDTVRAWGLIDNWGNYTFAQQDTYKEPCTFPYTEWNDRDPSALDTIKTDHGMDFLLEGIHVTDAWQLYAIAGMRFWPKGTTTEHRWGWHVGKRIAQTFEEQINTGVVDRGDAYPDWTERMDTILEGNEDSVPEWTEDPFTTNEYAEEWYYDRDPYIIGILAGGLKYYIRHEAPANYSGAFCDYGIFTKKNTGIDEKTGEVDIDTIEPIYAYAMKTGQCYPSSSKIDTAGIIYGMIIDGQHFMTEEFAYMGGDNGTTYDIKNGDFDIPGARKAVDSDGNPVTAKPRVRVGLMTRHYPGITEDTGE